MASTTPPRHPTDPLLVQIAAQPNRALFVDQVTGALDRARRRGWTMAVMAVNIDRFADTANRIGADSRDELIAEAARRLDEALHPRDGTLQPQGTLAHLGGDQFLVLCEQVEGAATIEALATRIEAVLRAPLTIAGGSVSLTAGIGYTVTGGRHHDPEALILEAETAMRRAKRRGAGCHEPFLREMQSQLRALIDDEDALRRALARDEFQLAYQPKVSLITNRITGVEALLRWHHPERGVIPPIEFIPLAEESGLIVPIGAWVLAQVCRDAKRWCRSLPGGRPLTVAVNVSARQFDSGLAETFGDIVASAGIDPTSVCLEVTESMVMRDPELAIATLLKLKSTGFRISIDDFGTGFSSLAYLSRFPLDELKIDKSFVDGLGHDPEATAIVAAVMGMSHALDLSVVGEGVETADQAARLRTLGCDEAQGYHFARPCPADDIDALLLAATSRQSARRTGVGLSLAAVTRPDRVLVVDDAGDVRQLARSSLAAVGFEVQEASSGEEAMTLMRHFQPDCVVLDLNLPGMSGLDVCRRLRADPAHQGITIVMLTVAAESSEKVEAFSLNADDYIVKPFSPRDLVSRVTAAMRRRDAAPTEAHA